MKNTFEYRHFLMCTKLANNMMFGYEDQNFAHLMLEEGNGRVGNKQMTAFFYAVDETLCDFIGNDPGFMWNELDMQELAEMSVEEIENDYEKYCSNSLSIKPIK